VKHHVIVVQTPRGPEFHALKRWLREHPDETPPGLSAEHSTSHQLRGGLRKRGWLMRETEDQVQLFRPENQSETNVDAVSAIIGSDDPGDSAEELEFSLESHLRDFIARNLATISIQGQKLHLFVDSSQRQGVEYPTGVGPIDILATDAAGNLVVFELKLSRGPDHSMGQLLRYMGWVKQHLAVDRGVHGVIVAKSMDDKLRYAALPVPNVTLLEYEIDFRLRPAGLLGSAEASFCEH